ncbi:hypothetical protein Hanom_Chr09g00806461 [Helianthus anomalus]
MFIWFTFWWILENGFHGFTTFKSTTKCALEYWRLELLAYHNHANEVSYGLFFLKKYYPSGLKQCMYLPAQNLGSH